MEFGKVPDSDLDRVDFTLPDEPDANQLVLPGSSYSHPKVYIGCTRWTATEWTGIIYPEKLKEKEFLQEYTRHFNCIELNATHYKIYSEEDIFKWAKKAGDKDFMFCPKMFKGVTHAGSLAGKETATTEFIRGVMAFGPHLGPIFIQLSDSFSPRRKEELFTYLQSLPDDLTFFLELRHPGWFATENIKDELFTLLRAKGIGAVITDSAGRRDCVHMQLSVTKVFIRYVGNGLHHTDYTRATAWAERIHYWLQNGLQEIYCMLHMQDESTSPAMAVHFIDTLNAICGLNLAKPIFADQSEKKTTIVTNGRLFD